MSDNKIKETFHSRTTYQLYWLNTKGVRYFPDDPYSEYPTLAQALQEQQDCFQDKMLLEIVEHTKVTYTTEEVIVPHVRITV